MTQSSLPGVWVLFRSIAQHAILNEGCVLASWHPDTLFQQDAIDTTNTIGEYRKAFFKAEFFKMDKAAGIERSIAILVRAEVIGTLVEKDFFVDFRQQQLWRFGLKR